MARRPLDRCILALLVMLAMGYAQTGYFLRFEFQRIALQRTIKHRIRQGVPKHELTPFRMSRADWMALNWVKPGREFRMPNGDMYDVVDLVERDGTVEALCIHDEQETQLFAGLTEQVRRQLDGSTGEMGARERIGRFLCQMIAPLVHGYTSRLVEEHQVCRSDVETPLLCGHLSRLFRPPWCDQACMA